MCNLMPVLLLCAVSELNLYLHLRLSWAKSGLIHTTAVATHTFQDDPEALVPYWSHFSFFRVINSDLSRKFLTRVLESDAFVSASGSSRYIYIYHRFIYYIHKYMSPVLMILPIKHVRSFFWSHLVPVCRGMLHRDSWLDPAILP